MSRRLCIGRDQGNDLVISHPYLSDKHAELSLIDANNKVFHIRDLGSTNGTYKNGKRIDEADFTLDDTIKLAGTTLEASLFLPLLLEESSEKATARSGSKRSGAEAPVLPLVAGNCYKTVGFAGLMLLLVSVAVIAFNQAFNGMVFLQVISLWLLLLVVIRLTQTVVRHQNLIIAEKHYRELLLQQWKRQAQAEFERREKQLSLDRSGWSGYRKFEIVKRVVENEAEDIMSFYLVPHDRKSLPDFRPGQYLTFRLNIPGQTKEVIRCYSLSDRWHENYYRVSIKKIPPPPDKPDAPPGLASTCFHEQLTTGAIIDVKAPSGKFYLNEDSDAGVVLIAGGVGLTPVLSMLNTLTHQGSTREIWFFYGVRNGRELAMRKHLKALAQRYDNVHMHWCFSDPLDSDVPGRDYDHNERISVDLFKRLLPSNNYEYYMCGPPPMMTSIVEGLEAWGVPERDIYFEAFGPASVKKKKADATPTESDKDDVSIMVEFARSGKKVPWSADSESLLALAEAHDIDLPYGCRAGNCGTCQVAIRSGSVSYVSEHDVDIESGSCLACISQPDGDLVLDA